MSSTVPTNHQTSATRPPRPAQTATSRSRLPAHVDPFGLFVTTCLEKGLLAASVLFLFPVLALALPLTLCWRIAAAIRARASRWFLVPFVPLFAAAWWAWSIALTRVLLQAEPVFTYVNGQHLALMLLRDRLGGGPLEPDPWRAWATLMLDTSVLIAVPVSFALCSAFPRFLSGSLQGGEAGGKTAEREGGNAVGTQASRAVLAPSTPIHSAEDVLYSLAHDSKAKRERLVGDHFTVGSVAINHGPSGVGKSRWLTECVRALVRGEPVFGWATVHTPVVWVTEESLSVWEDKARLIVRAEEVEWPWWKRAVRRRWPRRFAATVWPISLPDLQLEPTAETFPDLVALIERQVRRTGARLVILDTLMAVCPQAVKDNELAKVFMRQCASLAFRCRVAVEVVHHDNNDGNPLGAKMIKAACDYTHHVSVPEDNGGDERLRVVTFGKRYTPLPPPPLYYRMEDDGQLVVVVVPVSDTASTGTGTASGNGRRPRRALVADTGDGDQDHEEPSTAETMALVDAAHIPLPVPGEPEAEPEHDQSARVAEEVVRTMCAVDGWVTREQVQLVTGLPRTTAWKVLKAMERDGIVVQTKAAAKTAPARWSLVSTTAPTTPAASAPVLAPVLP